MSDKNGRVLLITGAGRGMGTDIAKAALAAGYKTVATGRHIKKATEAVGASDNLLVVKLDVTEPGDAQAAVKATVEKFGRIDVLVNNAGNFYAGFFEEITPENFRAQIETNLFGPLEGLGIPLAEFMLLTKIPIVIYYGDFIPKEPTTNPGQDGWRVRLEMARKWREAVNKHGGDVTIVHLPEVGIKGNTHFPFSDLNNLQIAELMSTWLNKKGLDKYP